MATLTTLDDTNALSIEALLEALAALRADDGGAAAETSSPEVFSLPGTMSVGRPRDVVNLDGDDFLQLEQATIAFAFTADTTRGTQGLFSRDASGYSGDGNHMSVYIQNGVLTVRLQHDEENTFLTYGGILANQEYAIGVTFDGTRAQLVVDDTVVDTGETGMTWATSPEDIQIGALGWRAASGDDQITRVFDGEIRDVAIIDRVLTNDDVNALNPGNTTPPLSPSPNLRLRLTPRLLRSPVPNLRQHQSPRPRPNLRLSRSPRRHPNLSRSQTRIRQVGRRRYLNCPKRFPSAARKMS